jgi:hypothetical protein
MMNAIRGLSRFIEPFTRLTGDKNAKIIRDVAIDGAGGL